MNYYIADTHFGHENIIKHCNRPFANAKENDKTIIENWNKVVGPKDTVYILGDFSFRGAQPAEYYLRKLNGSKILITGNHDGEIIKNSSKYSKYFKEITPMKEISDNGQRIVLCHYPLVEWNGFFRDTIHFYGHIHNNTKNDTFNRVKDIPNAYNCGVDILDFTPRTKDEVIEYNKKFILETTKEEVFR